jgi:CheY-like chemotaxis protein
MAEILIVDDAEDILQVLGFVLKKQGHSVVAAVDGGQALAKARENQELKVAFVDFNLPDMQGGHLAVELKKINNGIKVIMLSGREGVDAAGLGVDAFILKPFTSDQIKKILERFL